MAPEEPTQSPQPERSLRSRWLVLFPVMVLACTAVLASATLTARISPPDPECHRQLSGWFILGLPCVLASATLLTLVMWWVSARSNPWLLAAVVALFATWLSVHSWVAADPHRRAAEILGVHHLPTGSVIAFACFDTFNEGRVELGSVNLPAATIEQLIAQHRLAPPTAVPGAILDALGVSDVDDPMYLPSIKVRNVSVFLDAPNMRVHFLSSTAPRS